MPLIHQRSFRVRHYECDAYGRARSATYLNYMQEAAFDASAAAGYAFVRYKELGCYWLVRETDIEYLRPLALQYGNSVQVKTWVIDFRRVRSRRAYEFSLNGSAGLLARASTDWVLLDGATGRPASIPEEMMHAFFPEGAPGQAPPRTRFPTSPPPPSSAFQHRRRVQWSDVDSVGHVNNAVYLGYLEDSDIRVAAANRWPPARLHEMGLALAARRHQIEYREPAHFGDDLVLTTWLSDVDRTGGRRHFSITRAGDNALVLRARLFWEIVDRETGDPVPTPSDFVADLAPHLTQS